MDTDSGDDAVFGGVAFGHTDGIGFGVCSNDSDCTPGCGLFLQNHFVRVGWDRLGLRSIHRCWPPRTYAGSSVGNPDAASFPRDRQVEPGTLTAAGTETAPGR